MTPQPNTDVLDVGCRTGAHALRTLDVLRGDGTISAFDLSADSVIELRPKAADSANLHTTVGDVKDAAQIIAKSAMFSYDSFRAILQAVKKRRYSFARVDRGAAFGGKDFYLRHDVDISPACALRLGEIAAEEGVVSNFFFQLNAETYCPFSQSSLMIIRRLRSMGHCVGLHMDESLVGTDGKKALITLQWFSACCESVDIAASFHRPSSAVLGKDFAGFANCYGSLLWGPEKYLSDSRRSGEFHPRLIEWLAEGRTPIQLLLHPEWWHPHGSVEAIWADLQGRRAQELADYMLANFRKVFAPVISPTRDDFYI